MSNTRTESLTPDNEEDGCELHHDESIAPESTWTSVGTSASEMSGARVDSVTTFESPNSDGFLCTRQSLLVDPALSTVLHVTHNSEFLDDPERALGPVSEQGESAMKTQRNSELFSPIDTPYDGRRLVGASRP